MEELAKKEKWEEENRKGNTTAEDPTGESSQEQMTPGRGRGKGNRDEHVTVGQWEGARLTHPSKEGRKPQDPGWRVGLEQERGIDG